MRASFRFAFLLTGALFCSHYAYAAPSAACSSDSECSKIAFADGVGAYERGDYAAALARFQEALRLREHPVIAFNLALAESKNSLFLQAVNRLHGVIRDPRTPDNLKARVVAERELAARSLSTIIFDSPDSQGLSVQVDGQTVSGSPRQTQLNPGAHRITLLTSKGIKVQRDVTLVAGETLRVVLDSASELSLVVGNPENQNRPTTPGAPHKPLRPTWFYLALGSTLAVGAAATWSGLDTLSSFRSYDRGLPSFTQGEANERVAEGHSKQNRTNLLVGATGLLAIGTAGLGFLLVDWHPAAAGVNVSPTANGLMVSGQF